MKISRVLIFSLALNAGLAVAAVFVYQRHAAPPAENKAPESQTESASRSPSRAPKNKPVASDSAFVPASAAPEKFTWRGLESPEFKAYIANLRAVECPEETIRDIIVAAVNKLYAAKLKALSHDRLKDYKYWEAKNWWEDGSQLMWRKQRELEKEKKALLKELLGVDPEKEKNKELGLPDYRERMMSYLPEYKRDQVEEITQRYQDLEQDSRRKYKGYWGEETQAEQRELRAQRRAELAKILTPQELEEYDLRNSQVAQQMQWEMRTFDPSEAEFRSVYKAKAAMDEKTGGTWLDPEDKEAQEKYNAARKEMDEQLKETLGDKRFAEYKRGQDWEYQQLVRLANREGLAADAPGKIFDMKDAADAQARKVRDDSSLTDEQRKTALAGIRSETEKAVGELLGEKVLKKYKSQYGWWINQVGR
jgi:hypothetical protein